MKDLKISKELIKNVLANESKNLSEDFSFYIYEDYIIFSDDGEQLFDYNIYKFAFKCKEWAFKQGYELFSRILSNDHQMSGNCLVIRVESDPETVLTITNADTELEAIFKACEWVLENLKEKI